MAVDYPGNKRYEVQKPYLLIFYIIIPLLVIWFSVKILNKVQMNIFYTEEERRVLEEYDKVTAWGSKYYYEQKPEYKRIAPIYNQIQERHKYDGISIIALLKSNQKRKVLLLYGIVFSIWIGFIVLWYKYVIRRLDKEFFYRLPKQDEYLKYGNPNLVKPKWRNYKLKLPTGKEITISEVEDVLPKFKSKSSYAKFLALIEGNILTDKKVLKGKEHNNPVKVDFNYEESLEYIRNLAIKNTLEGIKLGILNPFNEREIKDFLVAITFVYLHRIASYYGNTPLGLLSIFIKDYTLKRVLSYYPFKKKFAVKILESTLNKFGNTNIKDYEANKFLEAYIRFLKINKEIEQEMEYKYQQIDMKVVIERIADRLNKEQTEKSKETNE